jgi:AcrR family transcriptional regulator
VFNQSQNPRVSDSMHRISAAFFELLGTYEYEEINIRLLCSTAGVTRKTFYRNFGSKDDILDYIIYDRLYYTWEYQKATTFEETLLSFFNYWVDKENDLTLFEKRHIFYLVSDKLEKYFEMNPVIASYISNQSDIMTFGAYFWNGLLADLMEILRIWTSRDFKETPRQLTDIVLEYFRAFRQV